jgi:hypothetical protein
MKKYIKVCDCPPNGSYKAFAAGKFREVPTKDGLTCDLCGHIAMDKAVNLNIKTVDLKDSDIDKSPDLALFEEWVYTSLENN